MTLHDTADAEIKGKARSAGDKHSVGRHFKFVQIKEAGGMETLLDTMQIAFGSLLFCTTYPRQCCSAVVLFCVCVCCHAEGPMTGHGSISTGDDVLLLVNMFLASCLPPSQLSFIYGRVSPF